METTQKFNNSGLSNEIIYDIDIQMECSSAIVDNKFM